MTITRLQPGPRMSQAVIHNDTIYLAGQVGKGTDVISQTKEALANIEQLLSDCDSDKSHILSATIWLADMKDFDNLNQVWDAWVDPVAPPTRACGEARLATPDYLVEFMIVAAKAK